MKLKNDAFRKRRGGNARLYEIYCEHCDTLICFYQKDGPGILKRLYVDRIHGLIPKEKTLVCTKCKKLIGYRYIFEKETRPAYKLFVEAVRKKLVASKNLIALKKSVI